VPVVGAATRCIAAASAEISRETTDCGDKNAKKVCVNAEKELNHFFEDKNLV